MKKKIKLAKYPWQAYPFTYKSWIDEKISDHVYDMYFEILCGQEWEHWKN